MYTRVLMLESCLSLPQILFFTNHGQFLMISVQQERNLTFYSEIREQELEANTAVVQPARHLEFDATAVWRLLRLVDSLVCLSATIVCVKTLQKNHSPMLPCYMYFYLAQTFFRWNVISLMSVFRRHRSYIQIIS